MTLTGGEGSVKLSNNSTEMQIIVDLQILKKSPTVRYKNHTLWVLISRLML